MSETAAEIVRRAVEAFAQNDREASWALWAEDATTIAPKEWPEAGENTGLERIRAAFDGFDDAFGPDWPLDLRLTRVEDLGEGRVLVEQEWVTAGVSSGAAVTGEISSVYTAKDGLIRHAIYFMNHAEGRKEAGVE